MNEKAIIITFVLAVLEINTATVQNNPTCTPLFHTLNKPYYKSNKA